MIRAALDVSQDAITSMNGKQLHGRTVTVELSGRPPKDGHPAPRGGDRMGDSPMRGGGGGFREEPRGGYGGGQSRGGPSNDMATKNLFVGNIPPGARAPRIWRLPGIAHLTSKDDMHAPSC